MNTNSVSDSPLNHDMPHEVNNESNNNSQVEMPTANQTTSESAATPSITSHPGLSFKDKVTLVLSVIAMLISATTFVIGRLDARATRAKEAADLVVKQKSQDYQAYSLGQQVVK